VVRASSREEKSMTIELSLGFSSQRGDFGHVGVPSYEQVGIATPEATPGC